MSVHDITAKLAEAEAVARSSIAKAATSDHLKESDYALMQKYIEIAQAISNLRLRIEKLAPSEFEERPQKSSSPVGMRKTEHNRQKATYSMSNNEFPTYFVDDGFLYKYALSGDNTGNIYRKKVRLEDAYEVCARMTNLLEKQDAFSLNELRDYGPAYKPQITAAALCSCGILRKAGRGRYALTDEAANSADMWVTVLTELPVRKELAERFNN